MLLQYKLPSTPHFAASGLREMEERDVEQVTDLYGRYMRRFDMSPVMTAEEVRHNFLSGKGTSEKGASGRREEQVLWVYVVEVISASFHLIRKAHQVVICSTEPRDEEDNRFLLILLPPIFNHRQHQISCVGRCISLLLRHRNRIRATG
jgi:hypothetical protein